MNFVNESPIKNFRRLSNSSAESYQLINEEKSINERNLYDLPIKSESEMVRSIKSFYDIQTESENNLVEFYSDRLIQDIDLDVILLFLESPKRTGSGVYLDFTLDSKRRLLTLNYEKRSVKSRILQKKNIKIEANSGEFNLIANEPLNTDTFEISNLTIILRNIDKNWLKDQTINIYAENLVIHDDEDNDIDIITQSEIFNDTIYIRYKNEFNLEKLKMRFEKRPILNKIKINFEPAYRTKIALVKCYDLNGQKISKDLIEMYFANKRRCGGESYISIHEREPFLLLLYETQESCDLICSKKHELAKHQLIVEPLYHYKMFEEELKNLEIKQIETKDKQASKKETVTQASEEKDKSVKTEAKQQKVYEKKNESEGIVVENDLNNKDIPNKKIQWKNPFIKIKSNTHPDLEILQSDSDLLESFTNGLLSKNSTFKLKKENNEIEIFCEYNDELPTEINEFKKLKYSWEKEVANFINTFLKQIKPQPKAFQNPIYILSLFEEPNIKVFKMNDLIFLNEFKSELSERQACVTLNEKDDKFEIVCECTHELPSNHTEYKELERKWKEDISKFVKSYLSQFDIKHIVVKYPNQVFPKLNYDKNKVNVKQMVGEGANTVFELIGLSENVENLIRDIKSKDIPIPIEEKKTEFIIDGFELHQIRILFIEKYIIQLKEKYTDIHVEINPKTLKVYLKGTQSQYQQAKILCDDILKKIKHQDIPMEFFKVKFFVNKEKEVVNWLRNQEEPVNCVLMPDTNLELVRIYSTDRSELKRCESLLKNEVDYKEIGKDLLEGVQSLVIDSFISKYRNQDGVLLDKENDKFYISGFKSTVENIFSSFLNEIYN